MASRENKKELPTRKTPEGKSQSVLSSSAQVQEKEQRVRTSSVTSVTSPPIVQTRKRTSSGVFQVDETEPPPKKTEHTRSNSDGALTVTNGRRKVTETPDNEGSQKEKGDKTERKKEKRGRIKEKEISKEEKVKNLDRFDSKVNTKCVSTFKESDSWD